MPIVEDGALSLGDSVLWETFHTRAKTYQPEGSEKHIETDSYAVAKHVRLFFPTSRVSALRFPPQPSPGSNQPCATMPLSGTHSFTPAPRFNGFPLVGKASNCRKTTSAISLPEISISRRAVPGDM